MNKSGETCGWDRRVACRDIVTLRCAPPLRGLLTAERWTGVAPTPSMPRARMTPRRSLDQAADASLAWRALPQRLAGNLRISAVPMGQAAAGPLGPSLRQGGLKKPRSPSW
jgi:hypothetical protein